MASERRRRRWVISAVSLCVVVGLQLAAVPPEVFADPGQCFMACSVEGKVCCCNGIGGEPADPHTPEAAGDGRLSSSRDVCLDLCATTTGVSGGEIWLLAEARHELVHSADTDHTVPVRVNSGRLDHSDPSTLPRPPPSPVALS